MLNRKLHIGAVLFLVCVPLACGGGGAPAEVATDEAPAEEASQGVAPDLSQAGAVSGKVNFQGEAPQMARIRMGGPRMAQAQGGPFVGEVYFDEFESYRTLAP